MNILGIESTCDETGAAIVEDGYRIHSNIVASQANLHAAYGGVVPEVAARNHIEQIIPVIQKALNDAGVTKSNIDGIAVASRPGLLGSLLVGTLTAKTLALAWNKPLYSVNHVLAHVEAAFLKEVVPPFPGSSTALKKEPQFPMLALIVSGGHTLLASFTSHLEYRIISSTRDDAAGEAFDKVAKLLGLPYPGGPSLSQIADKGSDNAFSFPKVQLGKDSLDFSFSGLKTAVLRQVQELAGFDYTHGSVGLWEHLRAKQIADVAASFERTLIDELIAKLKSATEKLEPKAIVIAGGVAANQRLRKAAKQLPLPIHFPPMALSTDNAAMIAAAGYHLAVAGKDTSPLQLEAIPTLNLK